MENIVPGTLRRLRAADIIRMAGLTTASLGQEHCRTGAVHNTQRQETRISGVVDLFSRTAANDLAGPGDGNAMPYEEVHQHRYSAEIELQSHTAWVSTCSCGTNSIAPAHICVHVATLLYQWLARPATFLSATAHPLTAEKAEERAPTTPAAKPPLIPASADDTLIEIHPAMTKVRIAVTTSARLTFAKLARAFGGPRKLQHRGQAALGSVAPRIHQARG